MQAAAQVSSPAAPATGVPPRRCDIVDLLDAGIREERSFRYAEATQLYYRALQPGPRREAACGPLAIAPMKLIAGVATRLRTVASKYAEELMERRFFLAGESPEGPIGLPRGALNLYLISNQYDVFTDCALQYAIEERAARNVDRFLISAVRARLVYLHDMANSVPLLGEELDAIEGLSGFKHHLHARIRETL